MSTFQVIVAAITFGICFGATNAAYRVGAFVKTSIAQAEAAKWNQAAIKWETEYKALLKHWNAIVNEINSKGGDRFLKSGVLLSEELAKLTAPNFSKAEINTLIKLCHPDKHGGNKAAEEITRKLLEMRK